MCKLKNETRDVCVGMVYLPHFPAHQLLYINQRLLATPHRIIVSVTVVVLRFRLLYCSYCIVFSCCYCKLIVMSFLGTTGSSLICPSACQPATGPAIPHRPRALCLSQLSPFPTLFLTFLEIPFIHHTLSLLWVHIANNNFLMHKARPPKKMFFPL